MRSIPWRTGFKAVGFDATRERVLNRDLASYSVVHFATHGLINSEHTELSGIVLSLFDEQGNSQDGFLRLHDIYNLRLPADLVVLSACSTGLGKEIKGEGLVGLTRGFMYAGASSVVASLWKVDDDATAELMRHFYDAMFSKGLTPAAALRDAQLKMSQDKRWHSPYYWAGFIIQGRYDEQVTSRELSLLTPTRIAVGLSLLGILVVALVLIVRRRRA
jgi:CHAT domain-containing protein